MNSPDLRRVNTLDYRNAPDYRPPLGPEWKDKPHRLIYDLCTAVEQLRGDNRATKVKLKTLSDAIHHSAMATPDRVLRNVLMGISKKTKALAEGLIE